MALVPYSLNLIRPILKTLRHDRAPERPRVLTFSQPDIIANVDHVIRIFAEEIGDKVPVIREDTPAILNWHKAHSITDRIIDTPWLFETLGCDYWCIDVAKGRGREELMDLSYPVPLELRGMFDFIFDCISNQCFNVAQAMANAWESCKVGGYVLHITPVQQVNQGFWSVSPTTYHDFYEANHGDIVTYRFPVGTYAATDEVTLEPWIRCRDVPDDTMNMVLVRKLKDAPITWPIMKKFQLRPDCKR